VGKILASEEKREYMGFSLQGFFLMVVGRTKRCDEVNVILYLLTIVNLNMLLTITSGFAEIEGSIPRKL